MIKPQISFEDFDKVDIRVGRVVKVEDFPEARKPMYKITVDLGEEVGVKQSAVGATHHYTLVAPDSQAPLGSQLF